MLLSVRLGEDLVGEMTVVDDSVEFRLTEAYRTRYPRPVLGQIFEDDPDRVHRSRVAVPPYFANLLPEGALRDLVARQAGTKVEREPYLLAYLGEDLPGAVRVRVEDGPDDDEMSSNPYEDPEDTAHTLKFSLAGVQLKFSAICDGVRRWTIPAQGRGGDWIVKLPDRRYSGVPENEWSMMTLARAVGLDVADVELVPMSEVRGLPPELDLGSGPNALAVRRFDRESDGVRVHIEDFAQILDVRPSHRAKYRSANFETLARLVSRIAPTSAEEFVRRLTFDIAIGNGDAHIKNWSLIYRDRINPALSPAYDLVSTIQYLEDDDLGLNLARSKRFEGVRFESFARLQKKAELAIDAVATARETVTRVRDHWSKMRADLPMTEAEKVAIEAHFQRVPLLSEE